MATQYNHMKTDFIIKLTNMAKQYNLIITDFKNKFGDRVWTKEDGKIKTYKGSKLAFKIECEGEYDDLEYYDLYWGDDEFNELLKKHKLHYEWDDSCIVNIYYGIL